MARNKQFKAESKRLLDLMINSIYTNRDIFLRELVSNASDADDKLFFKSLEDPQLNIDRQKLDIKIDINKDKRQLIISDNGIGMDKEELEAYLGTIANSGSYAFKEDNEQNEVDVIGQFGVGFYASFMVSDEVRVITKRFGDDQAYEFFSQGIEGYQIKETQRDNHGTDVILTIRENTEDIDYDKYLNPENIKNLIQSYSDYIRYPILMDDETLNSMIPIWKRSKNDVSTEELDTFYQEKFHDYEKPMSSIKMSVEGVPSFDALLFIPNHVPMDLYTPQYEVGLDLYSRGVFIMKDNKDLLPDYFRFVKGLVDSPDLPLNISREMLQDERSLQQISSKIKRKIKNELELMLKNKREEYEIFWKNFGVSIKFGIYSQFGSDKDFLLPLLLVNSSYQNSLTTLHEYKDRMKENQKHIYYVSGESIEKCENLAQTKYVLDKGYEVIYLTQEVDEFMIKSIHEYEGATFISVLEDGLDLETEEEKENLEVIKEESKDLVSKLETILKDKIDHIEISSKLADIPVYLKGGDGMSLEMEKILKAMPQNDANLSFKRILEINPNHAIFEKVNNLSESELDTFAYLLYDNACLASGIELDDTQLYLSRITELMSK